MCTFILKPNTWTSTIKHFIWDSFIFDFSWNVRKDQTFISFRLEKLVSVRHYLKINERIIQNLFATICNFLKNTNYQIVIEKIWVTKWNEFIILRNFVRSGLLFFFFPQFSFKCHHEMLKSFNLFYIDGFYIICHNQV